MLPNQFTLPIRPKLSEKDFSRVSQYIQEQFGIRLPIEKLVLVESRLVKRVVKLNLTGFTDYVNLVFSREGKEEQNMLIDMISTNKTDFFREDAHFKFLEKHFRTNKPVKPVNIWSSACSSGEETYTISMVMEELKASGVLNTNYSVLGSDISNTILTKAIKGEYQDKNIDCIPKELVKKYFTAKGDSLSVNDSLRKNITFKRFNLVDNLQYHTIDKKFDFIFCRNVLIYFDRATQLKVVDNLIKSLAPGGYLFLGHSETLFGANFPIVQIQPTVYQKLYV